MARTIKSRRCIFPALAIIVLTLIWQSLIQHTVLAQTCNCRSQPGASNCLAYDYYPLASLNCKIVPCQTDWYCEPGGAYRCNIRDVLGKPSPVASGFPEGSAVQCSLQPRNFYGQVYKKPVIQPPYTIAFQYGGYLGGYSCTARCSLLTYTYTFSCYNYVNQYASTRSFDLRYSFDGPFSAPSTKFRCNKDYLAPSGTSFGYETDRVCGLKNYGGGSYRMIYHTDSFGYCLTRYIRPFYWKFCVCKDAIGRLRIPGTRRTLLDFPSTDKASSSSSSIRAPHQFPMTYEGLLGAVIESKTGVFNRSRSDEWVQILRDPDFESAHGQAKRKRFQDSMAKYSGVCETITTPNGKESQTCCQVQGIDEWVCLPVLIVVGAQKSGTTPLFAHMLEHPEFRPGATRDPDSIRLGANPVEKEIHFFDHESKLEMGPHAYLHSFHSVKTLQRSAYINADFSPSYMIKYETMQGIKELLPRAKIVIMLRDPVERAWSELKMKIRQDIAAFEWRSLVGRHAAHIKQCVDKASSIKLARDVITAMNQCAVSVLTKHERWNFFVKNTIVNYVSRDTLRKVMPRADGTTQAPDFEPLFHVSENGTVNMPGFGTNLMGLPLAHYGSEFMDEAFIYDKLVQEIARIEQCLSKGDDTLKTCFADEHWMSSDIARSHVLRGMYYAQIKNIYELFSKDQVFIIENEELRKNPVDVMKRVCRFAGMSEFQFELADSATLGQRIDEHMPGFSRISGWRMVGSIQAESETDGEAGYGEVPLHIESLLKRFYEPHNEKLFELIGKRYDHWI